MENVTRVLKALKVQGPANVTRIARIAGLTRTQTVKALLLIDAAREGVRNEK